MALEAHEIWKDRRPLKGEAVFYEGQRVGTVRRLEGSLCWVDPLTDSPSDLYDGGPGSLFIWCFRDTLNALHEWPNKAVAS